MHFIRQDSLRSRKAEQLRIDGAVAVGEIDGAVAVGAVDGAVAVGAVDGAY